MTAGGEPNAADAASPHRPRRKPRTLREAYSQFYEAAGARQVVHDGDPVLASHVTSAAATPDEYGGWKVRKEKQSRKIDGLVASVIAFSRAAREQSSVWSRFTSSTASR